MKKIPVFIISAYQVLISPLLHHFGIGGCRYAVSCSEYAKQSVEKYGVIKGGILSLKRLSTCHPFQKASQFDIM